MSLHLIRFHVRQGVVRWAFVDRELRGAGAKLEKLLPAFAFLTPAKYKSITVEQIAKAMIATSLKTPANSAVYHHPEMMS